MICEVKAGALSVDLTTNGICRWQTIKPNQLCHLCLTEAATSQTTTDRFGWVFRDEVVVVAWQSREVEGLIFPSI